jgi:hypothetical protein
MPDDLPEPIEEDSPQSEEAGPQAEDAGSGDPDFDLGVREHKSKYDYPRIGAGVIIGLTIVGILLFSFTDLALVLIPMDDRYLNVLQPPAEDGSGYPFVLNELSNELEENTLSVTGVMTNNSTELVENVIAVIDVEETTGRFPATLEIPVDPAQIEPGESGTFSMSVTLRQKPNSYKVQFKLLNGPFVPHRDERGFGFETVFPPDDPESPIRLNIN